MYCIVSNRLGSQFDLLLRFRQRWAPLKIGVQFVWPLERAQVVLWSACGLSGNICALDRIVHQYRKRNQGNSQKSALWIQKCRNDSLVVGRTCRTCALTLLLFMFVQQTHPITAVRQFIYFGVTNKSGTMQYYCLRGKVDGLSPQSIVCKWSETKTKIPKIEEVLATQAKWDISRYTTTISGRFAYVIQ